VMLTTEEKLVTQKIKDNVVHVGHSQPSVLLKVYLLIKVQRKTSLNNNLLIVLNHMVTTDVTEVLWIMLSNTLKLAVLLFKVNIDMLEETKLVLNKEVLSKSQDSLISIVVINFKTPSLKEKLFQSLLMPQTGNSTKTVSSTIAKPN